MIRRLLLCVLLLGARPLTPEPELVAVQDYVNGRVTYEAEPRGQDQWRIADKTGDCEDFALLKRKLLMEQFGYSAARLKIIFALNRKTSRGHAVLLVDGVWVLDNIEDDVITFMAFKETWRPYCVVADLRLNNQLTGLRCEQVDQPTSVAAVKVPFTGS